jgi:hypothetical protein
MRLKMPPKTKAKIQRIAEPHLKARGRLSNIPLGPTTSTIPAAAVWAKKATSRCIVFGLVNA